MTKKHKITKRFLAFALSVAMIVTFTPTSFLAYAENPTKEAAVEEPAVEEPAAEPTAPAEEVVKEEPAKDAVNEEAPSKDNAIKNDEAAKEDVKEETDVKDAKEDTKPSDGIFVRAEVMPLLGEKETNTRYVDYDGQEHFLKRTSEDPLYELKFFVGGEEVSALPEGLSAELVVQGKKSIEDIGGTDAGTYSGYLYAVISGEAEGYYYDNERQKDKYGTMAFLVINPREVTVNAKGKTEEITYDGENHYLNMYELSCDDELYAVDKFVQEVDTVKPFTARDVGEHTTSPMTGFRNTNPNFDVIFKQSTGTLTIKPAKLTVITESARVMVDENSTENFVCEDAWVDGLVGRDALGGVTVETSGSLPRNQVGTTTNTGEITDWGRVKSTNYEVEYKFGTLTVYAQNEVQIIINGSRNGKTYYDGKPHSVEGYIIDKDSIDNPIFSEIYFEHFENGRKMIRCEGSAYVEETNAGFYPMGLTADQFSIDPSFEEAQNFKVTFIVRDGGLEILPRNLTVKIKPRNERHPYTGEEITMKTFDWDCNVDGSGYSESDFTFEGRPEIKETEIGIYSETLRVEQFHNLNSNYDVTFNVTDKDDGGGAVIKKSSGNTKAGIKDFVSKEYTATLKIFRPVVRVKLEGTGFTVPYDGNKHTLKVDAETNKAFFDGVEQEGSAFKVSSVENKYEVPFDENGIYLRSDIELSGTNAGIYRERNWVKRLSYDDPAVAVEFVADNDKAPMEVVIDRIPLKLVVDDIEVTYDGKEIWYYEENNMLTAHYENPETGEIVTDGPEYRVFYAGLVKEELPAGAFEQHYLDAKVLTGNSNYGVVEIEKGIFTLNKRDITVTVKGNKKRVYVERLKEGGLSTQHLYGYELICDDPYYNIDNDLFGKEPAFRVINKTDDPEAPHAQGKGVGIYKMGLDDPEKFEFVNNDNRFNVKLEIDDGYLEIIGSSTAPIQLGSVNITAEDCIYDGEFHPATLETNEVTVDGNKYTIELASVDYWNVNDNDMLIDEAGPINAGTYGADIGHHGCLKVLDGDVDVSTLCRWNSNEIEYTISKRPVTVTATGNKTIIPYDGKFHAIEGFDLSCDFDLYSLDKYVRYNTPPVASQKEIGEYEIVLDKDNFTNTNTKNYEVTFETKNGFLKIVGEENKFDIPRVTPINEVVPYDGEGHAIHYNFEELNEDGLFEVVSETDNNTYYVKPGYPRKPRRVEPFVGAGVYTWNRTISTSKVFDKDGADVTALVNNPWEREVYAGTLTITPIEATVNIKDGLCKTYGDPDPIDKSDWVEVIADEPALSEINNRLEIERVRGENVGKYEIRVSLRPIFVIDPGSPGIVVKDEGGEVAKKSVRSAKAEAKKAVVADEYEPYIIADTQPNIAIKGDNKDKFFTINKADLVITANNNQKNFGEDDPEFTATVGKGLVGSETLPKNFYTIDREKGEAVRMKPKFYEIVVDAPNVDVDWERETHYFKDELIPIPFDPPISQKDYEEVAAERIDDEEEYVRVAKSMKAARTLEAVKAEKAVETDSLLDAIKEYKEVPEADYPPEEEEGPWPGEVAAEPGVEVAITDNYSEMPSEFNLMNYNVITKNGEFYINGDSPSVDDPDDPDDPVVTADTDDSNNSGNKGSNSSTGDEFGLLGMMSLLTASLIGLLALVSRRRREQE